MKNEMRTATAAEAGAVARVINAAFDVERFFKRGERTSPAEVAGLMSVGEFLVLDGDSGGEGQALAAAVYVRPSAPRGYFGMLSVDPSLQGRGFARQLIDAAEDRCRRAGAHVLDIYVVNLRPELLPYYRRLGYEESGTIPFPRPEEASQPCHIIVMSKALI
jgi:ribosomal protein S18 acetylase RimI-like enzyme